MIELHKLEQSDFDTFISWIKDKDDLFQFAGSLLSFPVTNEQLIKYITDERRIVYKVILTETNEIIGNAELNFENAIPRLSRILIGNIKNRNKGIGRQIVNRMLEKLFTENNFQEADLNVFDWNSAGIKCYENVGFLINPNLVYKQNNDGEIWTAINMTITKERWNDKRIRINPKS